MHALISAVNRKTKLTDECQLVSKMRKKPTDEWQVVSNIHRKTQKKGSAAFAAQKAADTAREVQQTLTFVTLVRTYNMRGSKYAVREQHV